MAYAHSFALNFYGDLDFIDRSDRPKNLADAIASMPKEAWDKMAQEVFGVSGDVLQVDDVYRKAIETNTVSNLDSPVSVWIDPEGAYTVEVY